MRARIAELLAVARAGQAEFEAALPRGQAAVRRAGVAGSDSWIEAQQELSRLEAARARTAEALSELDSLGVSRSNRATSTEDQQAITQGELEVRTLADAQQAELARLSGQLGTSD